MLLYRPLRGLASIISPSLPGFRRRSTLGYMLSPASQAEGIAHQQYSFSTTIFPFPAARLAAAGLIRFCIEGDA